ncbi:LPS assembly protein LptD [Psychrosphaera sp. B3R10]|uniref:LPS-assembly protein LptD n=1 Tax=unclassified Psychrosphaera TaxID=2641570 RepID=UPI001C09AFB6|nr:MULTISPECIES: LPS assembly protein LptD [unclassified Psychrosphaera]MBU2881546.1 LPS assembly protein LptD [Psychrosphaera sp. I2R16]MBU2991199.1 LPS assembly protein LptD [Psychrosphaera sp. B3R10]
MIANRVKTILLRLSKTSLSTLLLYCFSNSALAAVPLCDIEIPVSAEEARIKKIANSYQSRSEIMVESDKAELIRNEFTEFQGNVVIFQQQQTVQADSAIYDELKNQFTAKGNIKLDSTSATVEGESIFIDDSNKDFKLLDAEYQFGFNSGRGKAAEFSIENNQKLKLADATFTTCPGDDPSWLFSSNSIYIDQKKGWGEAWNTTFRINDVPIIYVPYVTFPITDQRKTGLLFPELGNSSRYGAYYAQPIYFNIATNLDYTFTPKYMSERGTQLNNNLRYMTQNSYNILQLEYLDKDQSDDSLSQRYLAHIQHDSSWDENWNMQMQYTNLSDDNYISEFNSDYHHQADTHLNNFVNVNYFSEKFDASFLSQKISELGPHTSSYVVPIQLQTDWRENLAMEGVTVSLHSQYTHFTHNSFDDDRIDRLHFEPKLNYSYYSPAFQFETGVSFLSTNYEIQNTTADTSEDIYRGIFKYRLLTGLNFEKQSNYFGKSVRQTLEPKIQYVYVEEEDQSGIGLYDSQLLKEDYFALFRDNRYSSIDRISAMNQATYGFSTSIFDEKNTELLRFGIGQVQKFGQNSNEEGTNGELTTSKPSLAIEFFGRISEHWQLDGGFLYNRDAQQVDTGFVALDYYLTQDQNIQINHRFANDVAGIKINQTGLFTSYKLNNQWSIAASYHYDSERKVNLDSLVGFEYRSCCWSVQIAAQRQVRLDLNSEQAIDDVDVTYDNSIGLNFRINGLGGETKSAITKLFADSIFAYRRPYLITN